jgi:hypothetical protein
MKRFFLTAAVVALGFATLSVTQAQAGGSQRSSGGNGHSGSMSSGHREFKPSERFGYGKYGMKSFSWSHYRWNDYYRRYCYWAPGYGWYFYEPVHSCYLPVSYFSEVYPESVPSVSAPVLSTPTVTQQTTVVALSGTPTVGVPEVPPLPVPPVAPPAAAVQQTKVGPAIR